MKVQNKIVLAVLIATIAAGVLISQPIVHKNKYINSIIASIQNKDYIQASGQYGGYQPFVTVAVERFTTNKLPNITGTCSIGDTMTFIIKKGATGIVSETITKLCDTSPYSLNPTIALPDGKYRVDVKIALPEECLVGATTNGTVNNSDMESVNGTTGNDILNGNGGIDTLNGGACNDVIYASNGQNGSVNTAFSVSNLFGGTGDDVLYGGDPSSALLNAGGDQALNILDGTDETFDTAGTGETDVLNGGGVNSRNIFILGYCDSGNFISKDYYLGNGESDYASIYNMKTTGSKIDRIRLTGNPSDYRIFYNSNSGVHTLYRYNSSNNQSDLMAKIYSTEEIIFENYPEYFQFGCGGG
jgi:RTX calcium-binding nonapeptide repeat (4 copies)